MSTILYSFKSLKPFLKKQKPSKVCVITSRSLEKIFARELRAIPANHVLYLPEGERAKEWCEVENLLKQFIKNGLDRKSIIIAFGGGTIGDVVGFTSSIYLRGIRYIQVPTTLLAQVDSAHGGKTGINFLGLKNQVGDVYEPLAVVIETRFLSSLPKEEVISGVGEIIKAGLIKAPSILSLLKQEKVSMLTKSPRLLALVKKSIVVKHFYTNNDLQEGGIRQMLNAGHTIGHALELKHHISHGRAVLTGLLKELVISEALGLTSPKVKKNLTALLEQLEIPLNLNLKADWKSIVHDKKVAGDSILFPIIEREGKSRLVKLPLSNLREML